MKVWKLSYDLSSGYPTNGIDTLALAETFEDALQIFRNRLKESRQGISTKIIALRIVGDAAGLEPVITYGMPWDVWGHDEKLQAQPSEVFLS